MREGPTAVARLYLISLGTSIRSLPVGTLEMVSAAYLIQMNDGTNVLVDTGLPADYVPPADVPTQGSSNVIVQLALLGLAPDDIDILICTHFDMDHVGYNASFAGAQHVVQQGHLEAARNGHPRYARNAAYWDVPGTDFRLVDGDVELLPGLWLIETTGHAPAHQSVLVYLRNYGPILLVIDSVAQGFLFTRERSPWPMDDDAALTQASTNKLLDLVDAEQVQLVVFGHDGAQWRGLKTLPEYYD